MVEVVTFAVAAAIVLGGAIGVVALRNPVHCALSLVATFFGMAVLFVDLDAHFLAAVQVIVYAGAIVVLFLFVIMLLGVDKSEDLSVEPLTGQRPLAGIATIGVLAAAIVTLILTKQGTADEWVTGQQSLLAALTNEAGEPNIRILGRALFTDYLFAFEVTSVLLVIAVVGAVVLARTPRASKADLEAEAAEIEAARAAAEAEAEAEAEARAARRAEREAARAAKAAGTGPAETPAADESEEVDA